MCVGQGWGGGGFLCFPWWTLILLCNQKQHLKILFLKITKIQSLLLSEPQVKDRKHGPMGRRFLTFQLYTAGKTFKLLNPLSLLGMFGTGVSYAHSSPPLLPPLKSSLQFTFHEWSASMIWRKPSPSSSCHPLLATSSHQTPLQSSPLCSLFPLCPVQTHRTSVTFVLPSEI